MCRFRTLARRQAETSFGSSGLGVLPQFECIGGLPVVDAWWDDVGLAWEIDSKEFHIDPAGYDATMRKHSMLAASGVPVVHTVPGRLRDDAVAVLDEVERAYAQAKRRPRPDVSAAPWRPSP